MYTKMSIEHSIANPDVALQFAKNGAGELTMILTENSLLCMLMKERLTTKMKVENRLESSCEKGRILD